MIAWILTRSIYGKVTLDCRIPAFSRSSQYGIPYGIYVFALRKINDEHADAVDAGEDAGDVERPFSPARCAVQQAHDEERNGDFA